ncbi:MAG: hypothetical protein VB858_00690 [Planctomycetaceae bacterium]
MNSDDHRTIGQSIRLAHQVISISLELVIPVGIGVYFDSSGNCSPLWTVVGLLVGSGVACLGLRQLLRELNL